MRVKGKAGLNRIGLDTIGDPHSPKAEALALKDSVGKAQTDSQISSIP
jgi:hypothetical protein